VGIEGPVLALMRRKGVIRPGNNIRIVMEVRRSSVC
jgi:hypothetical protein